MVKKSKKNKGFSLLELLLYMGIFIILISVITFFSTTLIKSLNKNSVKKEVVQGTYAAMRIMLYEIKAAEEIYIPTSEFEIHPGQLSLKTKKNLSDGEEITYVDFYLDENNHFYIKRESQEPALLVSDNLRVNNLELEYLSSVSESVRIHLTIGYNTINPEYQYLYTLTSSATTRR